MPINTSGSFGPPTSKAPPLPKPAAKAPSVAKALSGFGQAVSQGSKGVAKATPAVPKQTAPKQGVLQQAMKQQPFPTASAQKQAMKSPALPAALNQSKQAAKGGPPLTRSTGGSDVLGTIMSIAPEVASLGPVGAVLMKPITETLLHKAESLGLALYEHPVGTVRNTVGSIPQTANAILSGTGRLAAETVSGHPGQALKELVDSMRTDYSNRYGGLNQPGGVQADANRIEQQGALPEVLDAATAVGGGGTAVGRVASKAVAAKGLGAADFAKVAKYREAVTHAYQHADLRNYLRHPDFAQNPVRSVPAPTRGEQRRAAVFESTQPRPPLRTAPGTPAGVGKANAARVQDRSPNLFRGLAQTKIDNARRQLQQDRLQRVVAVKQHAEANPGLGSEHFPVSYASQLAYDTRRGEVSPLLQRGGLRPPVGRGFAGAEKSQRMGASYAKAEQVRARRGEANVLQHNFNDQLRQATPAQRKLLVHAKEGMLPLHDPHAATTWLKELQAQAHAGSTEAKGSIIPWHHQMQGADVARELGSVLKEIQKHGPEHVFTPHFENLARTIPDERMTAPRDPGLGPDTIVARRYLPQQLMLDQWAERHPGHPLAGATKAAVAQIHQLLEQGHDLRIQAAHATGAETARLNEEATDKLATAKNLADENARAHGLPTDRAYIEHTRTLDRGNWLHTVGVRSPADYKRWSGALQKMGYRSTSAELILRGMLKNIRHDYNMRFINRFDSQFGTGPRDMTATEAQRFLAKSGRNPDDWTVGHLGTLRTSIADRANADHLAHLDSDPQAHAQAMQHLVDQASHLGLADSPVKGARLYPKAAWDEMRNSFGGSGLAARLGGRLKAGISKEMLGFFNLPWVATMGGVTYPVQSLMAGAGPFSLRESAKWYHGLSRADQSHIDQAFGIDSKFEAPTHGISDQRLGSAMPKRFENIAQTLRVVSQSPFAQSLRKLRPDEMLLKVERTPRRWARINAAYKGVKNEALRQILTEAKGAAVAQSKLAQATTRMTHFGRMPSRQYLNQAMQNQRFVEAHAEHLNRMMGEWHKLTQFERNTLNRTVMFYPWLRYSMKLAFSTLPTHHPLLLSMMGQFGTMQRGELQKLLGTDPPFGNVYLGQPQPNTPAEQRQWNVIGARQANPLLNNVMDVVAGSPGQAFDALPPYMSAGLQWMIGKDLFSDKPFKGSGPGGAQGMIGRPNLPAYMLNQSLVQPLAPLRALNDIATQGRPQAPDSLFGSRPVQYGAQTQAVIDQEAAKRQQEGILPTLIKREMPLFPHSDQGALASKIRAEKKKASLKGAASGGSSSGGGGWSVGGGSSGSGSSGGSGGWTAG